MLACMVRAQVALESTVFAHGLPYPISVEVARQMEERVCQEGAEPRIIGILDGEIVVGLTSAQVERLAKGAHVQKVSRRNLPVVVARKMDGATTVAATMWIAHQHGIRVFATGGIGGVHRRVKRSDEGYLDISADLEELGQTPVAVVCSGAKAILDLPATREYLETKGVTVVGYGTEEFPAFFSRSSGLPVDARCDTPGEVAEIIRARLQLGLPGSVLVAVPVPHAEEIPFEEMEPLIEQVVEEAAENGLISAALTPCLLQRLARLTENRSLRANIALLKNNARVAAQIARVLADMLC